MTRKRPPLAALALIGVSALISACGSTAPAGTGRGNTIAANHELAVEVTHAGVPTPSAPSGSLRSISTASRSNPDPSMSSRSSAPSPTGKLPSAASSPLTPTRRTPAGSTPGNPPARSLPGRD
jgi:hypothetical protein